MSCVDLSNDSSVATSEHPSGLCTVCQRIDFVSLTSETCSAVCNDHFHIGHLQHVARKEFCPGCRLILSATRSSNFGNQISEESTITIRQRIPKVRKREKIYNADTEKMIEEKAGTICGVFHVEGCIEVEIYSPRGFSAKSSTPLWVAGVIMRTNEAELANLNSSTGTIYNSTSQFCVRGRTLLPEVNIDLVKHWMQFCNSQHQKYCIPAKAAAIEQKIRLVDVHEYKIISTASTKKYVALSYVWGSTTKPLLTRDTISQYSSLNGLKASAIPQTISDTIQLVRDIGMRYLWVDSLCIIQDNDNDREQQLPIMDSIYRYAELVVIAANGSDAYAGLPGVGSTKQRHSQQIEEINGIRFISVQPAVQHALNLSEWNTRGWTFQEAILSRRALIFTENQLYWNCQFDIWREDLSSESSINTFDMDEADSIYGMLFKTSTCRTNFYCRLVEQFSQRAFKEERDALWAFMGVLKLQKSNFQKGFIWGLPYERLDATLLWSENSGCDHVHPRHAQHDMVKTGSFYNLPYPSWSWLSSNISVSFMDQHGDSIISEVTWHEPFKLGDETYATFLKSIHSKDYSDEHKRQRSANLLSGCASGLDVMDYGLLHFTAQTALLVLRRKGKNGHEQSASKRRAPGSEAGVFKLEGAAVGEAEGDSAELPDSPYNMKDRWITATIHTHVEELIGKINVPLSFFNEKFECSGEFVLLSSNAEKELDEFCKEIYTGLNVGNIEHVDGCKHIRSRNIMLIEWVESVAHRRGLATVDKNAWRQVQTTEKRIVLG